MRLDLYIAEKCVLSRTRAQNLIKTGGVLLGGKPMDKPSQEVAEGAEITIVDTLKYASIGGLKLENALRTFGIDPKGRTAIDIGAANGGFTDCLLQMGASEVCAVDLNVAFPPSLSEDSRVRIYDGVNVKNLPEIFRGRRFDLVTADLSFISLCGLFPIFSSLLSENGSMILLFKPQFEVGKKHLPKSGIVRDEKAIRTAFSAFCDAAAQAGLTFVGECPVPPVFPDKNKERTVCFCLK